MSEILVCPECKTQLKEYTNKLSCEGCGKEYLADNGFYDFIGDAPYYWNEIPVEETENFLKIAREKGWKDAARYLSLKHSQFDEYIMSKARADWLFHCVDFSSTKTCLDIGSGWGAIVFTLSSYFDEVWSLEAVKQRIEFQRIRREQENIKNIKFVRSDWLTLPFPDNYFDIVSSNGVLEWVGLSDYSRNPRELQLEFIREIRRILKPGGCLYIGIENRYSLDFFLGNKDHSGLPFTSILPRNLSNVIVRLSQKAGEYRQHNQMDKWPDYRTYTYSLKGYRDLLKTADFNQVDFYWTTAYNNPKFAGKFGNDSISYFLHFLRSRKSSSNLAGSIGISVLAHMPKSIVSLAASIFAPDFLIYAYKGEKNTLFESKLIQLESPVSSFIRISGSQSIESKINYLVFKEDKFHSVIKFPRSRKSIDLSQEEEIMSRFNHIDIKRKSVDSVPVFIEPAISGKQSQALNHSHNLKILQWLLDFQNKTQNGFWDYNLLEKRILQLSDFVATTEIDSRLQTRTRTRVETFLKSLQNVKLPVTSEHGDFCNENIIVDRDKLYVVDWEFYEESGDPLFDFVFFLLTNSYGGASGNSLKKNLNCEGKYSRTLVSLLSMFSKSKNLAPEVIIQAIPVVILKRLHRIHYARERHFSKDYLYNLLTKWDEIDDSATSRILSRLQIHR